MPSKTELKQEIDTLRANLKDTTKRLTALESNPNSPKAQSVEKAAVSLFIKRHGEEAYKSGEAGETLERITQKAEEYDPAFLKRHPELKGKDITVYHDPLRGEDLAVIDAEEDKVVEILSKELKGAGNPELLPSGERARLPAPKCDLYISKIESEIAAGKSYWDIAEEQYERWIAGEDRCLPCEREYVEAKESLIEIGDRYRNLIRPEDAKIEAIAESLREDSTRELYKAEAHIKTASASCNIKFPRVRSRLLKMKPLAHVGRWGEFMDNQKQLISDLEQDVRETIPDIKVRAPSYAVPRYLKEVEKIVPRKPTPEEEKEIEETRRLAALGRKVMGGV